MQFWENDNFRQLVVLLPSEKQRLSRNTNVSGVEFEYDTSSKRRNNVAKTFRESQEVP